jgi:hypothetical protein
MDARVVSLHSLVLPSSMHFALDRTLYGSGVFSNIFEELAATSIETNWMQLVALGSLASDVTTEVVTVVNESSPIDQLALQIDGDFSPAFISSIFGRRA